MPDDFPPVAGRLNFVQEMNTNWLEALQDAIHETDPRAAELKIRIAETVITDRIGDLDACPDPLEKQALLDALGSIRLLRSTRRLASH
jgi:hypothetical protein